MDKKNLKNQHKVKSVDIPADSSIKEALPKRNSVSLPLQAKRSNFLLSHVDLDTSYNLTSPPTGQVKSNRTKMSQNKTDADEKQFSTAEKGLLRRFMQSY